jgi:chemotaxis-related protein WspD
MSARGTCLSALPEQARAMADMSMSSGDSFREIPGTPEDCWNHIGVRGNRSCPELTQCSHCRNCPVYAKAARRLLDRPQPNDGLHGWEDHYAIPAGARQSGMRSMTVFSAGSEKFALETRRCAEAVNMRMIHRVPHLRECVLGLANIHGELILCVSFAMLLGLETPERSQSDDRGKLLVTDWRDGPIALAVDEAIGVRKFSAEEFKPLPASLLHSQGRCSASVLDVDGASIGVLDDALLEQAIKRQLA